MFGHTIHPISFIVIAKSFLKLQRKGGGGAFEPSPGAEGPKKPGLNRVKDKLLPKSDSIICCKFNSQFGYIAQARP